MNPIPSNPKRLLIVEDDPIIATLYQRRFAQAGYAVEVCADGQAAFYRLHEASFSAVLMDLMLPQMNGVEILGKIRAQKRFATLPVIVLTNTHLDDLAGKAVAAGATRVFFKSAVTPTAVLGAVNACLTDPPAQQGRSPARSGGLSTGPADQLQPYAPAPCAAPAPGVSARTGGLLLVDEASFHAPASDSCVSAPRTDSDHGPDLTGSDAAFFAGEQRLKDMRRWLKSLQRAATPAQRLDSLHQLVRLVHLLASPGLTGELPCLARLSEAFEALLWELAGNPSVINESTLMTLSRTTDCLSDLVVNRAGISSDLNPSVMVVDDDPFSRRAMVRALAKVGIIPVVMDDPSAALECLRTTAFDLVILDVRMPEISGFEVCKQMRQTAVNDATPAIFVTSLNDFQSRVQSVLSGGHELIVKPYLLIELAVKVLVLAVRRSLQTHEILA